MDAKSGPWETGDFGEIGDFTEAIDVPAPWRLASLAKMAILVKIARGLAIMAINVPAPCRLEILAKMAIVSELAILAIIARGIAISRM